MGLSRTIPASAGFRELQTFGCKDCGVWVTEGKDPWTGKRENLKRAPITRDRNWSDPRLSWRCRANPPLWRVNLGVGHQARARGGHDGCRVAARPVSWSACKPGFLSSH